MIITAISSHATPRPSDFKPTLIHESWPHPYGSRCPGFGMLHDGDISSSHPSIRPSVRPSVHPSIHPFKSFNLIHLWSLCLSLSYPNLDLPHFILSPWWWPGHHESTLYCCNDQRPGCTSTAWGLGLTPEEPSPNESCWRAKIGILSPAKTCLLVQEELMVRLCPNFFTPK